MEKIDISITEDGAVNLQLAGFEGGKCLEITKILETLLGNEIVERNLTSEYYTAENVKIEEKLPGS
ncbi:MAG: DUF2997 domain-containing protein [Deltaproteobacteria bacterium]|nr:DUF2997 domain-containing protein [Deltaproteobacteria bacterium]